MSLNALTNLVAASGVVGTVLPLLVALVNQEHWSARVKGLVTAGLSTVAGVLTAWQAGDLGHGQSWLVSTVVVLLVASGAYQGFWKPTRLAPLIEALTSFAASKVHPSGQTPTTPPAK